MAKFIEIRYSNFGLKTDKLFLDVFINDVLAGFDRLQFQLDGTFEPTRKNLLRVADQEVDVLWL